MFSFFVNGFARAPERGTWTGPFSTCYEQWTKQKYEFLAEVNIIFRTLENLCD